MHVTLVLPVRDLSRWFPPGRYKNYTADVVRELGPMASDLLVVAWDQDVARPSRTNVHAGQVGFIIVEEDFGIPADAGSLQMRSALLANLPNDHQQLAMVEDARRGPALERILAQETLTAQQDTLAVELPEVPAGNATPIAAGNASGVVLPGAGVIPAQDSTLRRISLFHPNVKYVAGIIVFVLAMIYVIAGYLRRRGRVGAIQGEAISCSLSPVPRGEGWGEGPCREFRNSPHRPSPQPSPPSTGEREPEGSTLGSGRRL